MLCTTSSICLSIAVLRNARPLTGFCSNKSISCRGETLIKLIRFLDKPCHVEAKQADVYENIQANTHHLEKHRTLKSLRKTCSLSKGIKGLVYVAGLVALLHFPEKIESVGCKAIATGFLHHLKIHQETKREDD